MPQHRLQNYQKNTDKLPHFSKTFLIFAYYYYRINIIHT